MKKIIIVLGLALLMACSKQPEFSLSDSDQLESVAKNPAFETTISANKKIAIFKFNSTPQSFLGIQTNDINVLGGYVQFEKTTGVNCGAFIVVKTKESYEKLLARLKKYPFQMFDIGFEKGMGYHMPMATHQNYISLIYNPFADIATLGQFSTNGDCHR